MKGPTFKNQITGFGGIGNSFFSLIEKNGMGNVGQKWVMVKLEYDIKMCHTHTIFPLTVVLTIAPPITIRLLSSLNLLTTLTMFSLFGIIRQSLF